VISDSGSNSLLVLPSLGGGFFSQADAMVIPLAQSPGPIIPGSFGPGTGQDIAVLDPETNDVTLISGLASGSPLFETIASGGTDPVAAVTVPGLGGFDDLVVANNASGGVGLLAGGPGGLTLEQVNNSLDSLNPTGLAYLPGQNNSLEVYASTAGVETAFLLTFSLGGLPSNVSGQGLTLIQPSDSSLPLIATLLTPIVNLNATEEQASATGEGNALVVATATASPAGLGQGPFTRNLAIGDEEIASEQELEPGSPSAAGGEKAALPSWLRVELGLDEAFDAFRRANQPQAPPADGPGEDIEDETPPPAPSADYRPVRRGEHAAVIDAAIELLTSRFSRDLGNRPQERGLISKMGKMPLTIVHWHLSVFTVFQAQFLIVPSRPPGHRRLTNFAASGRTKGSRSGRGARTDVRPSPLARLAHLHRAELVTRGRCPGNGDRRARQSHKPRPVADEHADQPAQ
jgi:hypothetical protein